jgi:hypothetical protein
MPPHLAMMITASRNFCPVLWRPIGIVVIAER